MIPSSVDLGEFLVEATLAHLIQYFLNRKQKGTASTHIRSYSITLKALSNDKCKTRAHNILKLYNLIAYQVLLQTRKSFRKFSLKYSYLVGKLSFKIVI